MVRIEYVFNIFAVISSAAALKCYIQVRNDVGRVVGSTCVNAGATGSVTSSQTGANISFKTSNTCGVDPTGCIGPDESLSPTAVLAKGPRLLTLRWVDLKVALVDWLVKGGRSAILS